MKSIKTISLSTAALMALLVGGIGVNAATGSGSGTTDNNIADGSTGAGFVAEDSASAKSTAEFAVTAGKLTLDAVPDMHFKSTTVKSIATAGSNGVVLAYQNGTVTKKINSTGIEVDKDTFDGNHKGLIRVSDFRGTGAGWNLSVSLGQFKNGNDEESDYTLKGTTLKFSAITNSDVEVPAAITVESGATTAVPVATADVKTGMDINDFTIDSEKTTLTIAKNADVQKGTYQADLTWTLANTAENKAAQ